MFAVPPALTPVRTFLTMPGILALLLVIPALTLAFAAIVEVKVEVAVIEAALLALTFQEAATAQFLAAPALTILASPPVIKILTLSLRRAAS